MKKLIQTMALLAYANSTHGACYMLQDSTGKVLYTGHQPPFDISAPPESAASIASKKAGQRLQIFSDKCPTDLTMDGQARRFEEETATKPQSVDHATAMALKMLAQDQQRKAAQNQVNEIRRELDRYHEGALKDLKRYNDIHEALYPR
jgi:hypothetical protein